MTLSYTGGMILYIATFELAFVSVVASLVLIVGLALLLVFPEPTGRAGSHREAGRNPAQASPTLAFLGGRFLGLLPGVTGAAIVEGRVENQGEGYRKPEVEESVTEYGDGSFVVDTE